ncbi:MAG: STAS domain-containing protein [Rhodoferax sp.]|nr:STAS domain-containing protein [Rhodoferax sp.]
MELVFRTEKKVQIVAVRGHIDHAHANAFEAALAPHLLHCKAAGMPLVLDFSGVDFISSVGLRVLMLAAKQAKLQQGKIAMAALTPIVSEVFQVSRFNLVLQVYGSVDEAILALAS